MDFDNHFFNIIQKVYFEFRREYFQLVNVFPHSLSKQNWCRKKHLEGISENDSQSKIFSLKILFSRSCTILSFHMT